MASGNGNQTTRALIGLLVTLITAGIIASVGMGWNTGQAVGRLDENLGLFREEVRREFDSHDRAIRDLNTKLDRGAEAAGGSGGTN